MKTAALMIVGALLAVPARAADTSPTDTSPKDAPKEAPKDAPVSADNIHAYGDKNPSCPVWTDGCRRCDRANGTPNCSNIGIACQPGPVRCEGGSKSAK